MSEALVVADRLVASGLRLHRWPRLEPGAETRTLVLLHGWGSDSQTWSQLRPLLQAQFDLIAIDLPGFGETPPLDIDLEQLLQLLAEQLPEQVALLGWSLGGMIATAYAGRFAHRVTHLVTLATNASFVRRPGWPEAMSTPVFRQFVQLLQQDPGSCLQRFAALQVRGDTGERALLKTLRRNGFGAVNRDWHRALDWLRVIDNRAALANLQVPSLHLLGERDALVPVTVAGDLLANQPVAVVEVLPGVGHLPQLACPALLAPRITAFVGADGLFSRGPYQLEKRQVAASFGRAAATYDSVAHLQRAIGQELLARLDSSARPAVILDVGCGTGLFADLLQQLYPRARCLGLDLAEGMTRYCRQHRQACSDWICGDAEGLPLASGAVDLAFSNFTLQWCQELDAAMAELARVVRPGGRLIFSTLGPASLWQLRQAWSAVDGFTHVNRFATFADLRSALQRAGWYVDSFDARESVQYYPDLGGLTRELKSLGAHNVNAGRNTALTGRRRLTQLKRAYEQFREERGLPASWEIGQVVATRT